MQTIHTVQSMKCTIWCISPGKTVESQNFFLSDLRSKTTECAWGLGFCARVKIDVALKDLKGLGSIDFATKSKNRVRLLWNFSHDCTLNQLELDSTFGPKHHL